MCSSSKPKVTKAPDPIYTPAPPPPEPTATAPVVNETVKRKTESKTKKSGTSALRIDLNIGGGSGGLIIPR
jgi:hypothetical protein